MTRGRRYNSQRPVCLRADQTGVNSPNRGLSATGRTISGSCGASCRRIRRTMSRHEAAVPRRKPAAPMRARDVADVGHRLAAKLQWPRHAPARHNQFALTLHAVAHDRRKLVGKDSGNTGRLPVLSCAARNRARIAAWPLVSEYRLHMWGIPNFKWCASRQSLLPTTRSRTSPSGKSGGRGYSRSGR